MKTEKKSGAERTQLAVRDEWWTDERILSFLALEPAAGENSDFHILSKAYQGMVPESFERFLEFYLEAGKDLDATDRQGKTISQIIATHRHGTPYLELINTAKKT
jgi:hypothetical protein